MLFMVDKVGFGQWLQVERAKRGWSQAQFARICGIDRQIINKTENGVSSPTTETYIAISNALGIPLKFILNKAGLIRINPDEDPIVDQIEHLYQTLQNPNNRQSAIKYLEYLLAEEQKGATANARQNPQPKPRQST